MLAHGFHRLPMLVRLLQYPIAGHDAAFDLIEEDVPPKLDLRVPS